jgi:hypothetical protein
VTKVPINQLQQILATLQWLSPTSPAAAGMTRMEAGQSG